MKRLLSLVLSTALLCIAASRAEASDTNYAARSALNHVFSKGVRNFTAPTTLYVSLFTVAPNAGGTGGTEVSGTGYARQSVTFADESGRAILNSNAITFGTTGSDWGTPVSIGIYDAVTSGNLLEIITITTPAPLPTGTIVTIPISGISISRP